MKQIIRYRFMTIPGKIQGEIRLTINDITNSIYSTSYEGGKSINISIFPIISLAIIRKYEVDDLGNRVRSPWNPNDSIGMTKFNFPIFLNELKTIYEKMKTPNLYTYKGSRLELNDKLAESSRSVFTIGGTVIELSPVIIEDEPVAGDVKRQLEGVKMKFNNEQSSVLLTINELICLIHNLEHLDVDSLTLQLFSKYVDIGKEIRESGYSTMKPVVDITPKTENKPSDDFPF